MAERTSPATLRSQPDFEASPTFLTSALPPRAGQRPRTESCLPHAQMEAESPDDVFAALTAAASASLGKDVVQGPTTVSVPSTWPAYHLCKPCGAAMPREACMTPGGPACGLEPCGNQSVRRVLSAMMLPCWLRRAVKNRHRHAIEQASRRWRGRDDSARTRREILISTQV